MQIKGYIVYYFGITVFFLNLGADYLFKIHAKFWAKIRLVAPNTNYHKGGFSDKVLQCTQPKLT